MSYDMVDAYEDINTLNDKLNLLIGVLKEKKIIEEVKENEGVKEVSK